MEERKSGDPSALPLFHRLPQQTVLSVLVVSAVTLVLAACTSGRTATKPAQHVSDPRWAVVDSLERIGQFATALERTDVILFDAQTNADWRTEFKAWMKRGRFLSMTGVEPDSILRPIERRAATSDAPLRQLLYSVVGQGWWELYQSERWRIMERTELAETSDDADPGTWTQQQFMAKVIGAFRNSVEPYDTLRTIPVGDLGELLVGSLDATELRPWLYDVLAHRAAEIFTNPETRITEPAWRFTLDDPSYFELFESFFLRRLEHRDSTAFEFLALRTYQRLERAHIGDDKLDAYVDVALKRLAFVHDRSTHPRKDSLHLEALEILASRLPRDAAWSEVAVAIASWHAQQGEQFDRLNGDAWKWEKRTARILCDSAIVRWPGSFGARNAKALKARLEQGQLRMLAEQAEAPALPFRVALWYANTQQVWLRVVKDPLDPAKRKRWDVDHGKWLTEQKPVREWNVALPDDGDLNQHLIELPVEGLPFGRYAILVSDDKGFGAGADIIAWSNVWITSLAMVERTEGPTQELLLLDRLTGKPKEGVKAVLLAGSDQGDGSVYRPVVTVMSDKEGTVRADLSGIRREAIWSLTAGEDHYLSGQQWHYDHGRYVPDSLRTFLFTDRAIYRPGQTVHFKGIVTAKRGKTTATKGGYGTTVKFFDVNYELLDSLNVTTDAFGSFHGSFTAPTGTLTGSMQLQESHGSRGIQVEEYKRPTFEVVFDPITATPKLGEAATVTGVAKSYAGVPLDGATVQWTVKRGARMPWWCGWGWRGLPWGRETEIASGTANCDPEGKFNAVFIAAPDRMFPRNADPVFSYTIEASATDINGETQSANTSLSVGHRSVDILIDLPNAIDRETADSIAVRVVNLNGQAVDLPMDIRIVEVSPPSDAPQRDRVWERPDRVVEGTALDSTGTDPLTWPMRRDWLRKDAHRAQGSKLALEDLADQPVGLYRIDVRTTDPAGTVVKASRMFTLYDTAIQNTGFVNEAMHVEPVAVRCEPGGKAVLLLSSALPECRVLMEVERDGLIAVARPFTLRNTQQRIELPVMESDRGGFAVHFVSVERGRAHTLTQWVDVPWSNKDLQVQWMSFRDKMLPGAKEEWRLKITGPKKEQVSAQLLAGMYDASLDHFVPHDWSMSIWGSNHAQRGWGRSQPFGSVGSNGIHHPSTIAGDSIRHYPELDLFDFTILRRYMRRTANADARTGAYQLDGLLAPTDRAGETAFASADEMAKEGDKADGKMVAAPDPAAATPQPVRSDFRETAFFFPDLLTDRDGSVVLRFTMPDALTRWKFMGLAHTKDLRLASFTKEATTSKPLMVVPNLPRFLRHGDSITLTAKINAVEGDTLHGKARMELFDPRTNAVIDPGVLSTKDFAAAPGASANVSWTLRVSDVADVMGVRITARADDLADGEEHVLPVLTDRVLVTESLPIAITKAGTKTFTLAKLKNTTSSTLRHQSLKLEFTPNPAWYAVQALPYLMEFPHECAEQVFSRYYANRLAGHIVHARPAVEQVFKAWRAGTPGNENAFLSALGKNPELKNAVLQETPWVMEAKDEGERKRRTALFFDLQRMATEEATALGKLRDMQLPEGGWGWWSGMRPSRYITQHIVAGFGHLKELGALELDRDATMQQMTERAILWLDRAVADDYQRMRRTIKGDTLPKPGSEDIHYLYARSFFPKRPIDRGKGTAAAWIIENAQRHWLDYGLQEQAMIALALQRITDERSVPQLIIESLSQRATRSEELGMYWKGAAAGFNWNQLPTETHALMVEAFDRVAQDKASVDALRLYLLKLKQTTDWKTTKATADACYALLLTGDDWLAEKAPPTITVGNERVKATAQEAGTGFFEERWTGEQVKPAMGDVTVTTTADGAQWGALHWQYFEQMDKVTPHESPFSVRKQVMLHEQTDGGARLVGLDQARSLKPGDKLTVRVELRTDRYVDYVHLKDLRAAGLEPTEAISGYKWQGGLGYYQGIRDAAMHFFIDRIAPGTYVFEYDLRVTHAGDFSNGITTAMCMYAPEFSSHSEGIRLRVGDR